jgi:hypothetical protein
MLETAGVLQDFTGFLPATRDSLPPLDPASLIPVSPQKQKKKAPSSPAR